MVLEWEYMRWKVALVTLGVGLGVVAAKVVLVLGVETDLERFLALEVRFGWGVRDRGGCWGRIGLGLGGGGDSFHESLLT